MAGLGLGGARTAIGFLYPHPPHQCFEMPTADLAPLGSQQASQHPRTGEWKLGVRGLRSENLGGVLLTQRFPSRNLIGVDVEIRGQLGYRSGTLNGGPVPSIRCVTQGPATRSSNAIIAVVWKG